MRNKLIFFSLILFIGFFPLNAQNDINKNLINAVKEKDFAKVKELTASGANVNFKDEEGNFPLFFADNYWEIEITEFLLKSGADPNLQDSEGNTVLHKICNSYYSYRNDLTKLLYYYKADSKIKNNEGITALEFAEKKNNHNWEFFNKPEFDIYFLAQFGTFQEVKDYFKKYKPEINKPDKSGYTIISYAVIRSDDDVSIVKFLLENGANPELTSWQFLDIAIENNNFDLLKILFKEKGLRVPVRPILVAIRNDNFEIFKILYTQPKSSDFDSYDESRLVVELLERSDMKYFEFIFEKGFDINKRLDDSTPLLHYACGYEEYSEIKIKPEIIDFLIKKGADPNLKDQSGNSPLVYLIKNKVDFSLIENFVKNNVKLNEVNQNNESIIHHLVKGEYDIQSIDFFVKKGAPHDGQDYMSRTPLYYACKQKNIKQINYLLEKGADVKKINFAQIVSFADYHIVKKIINEGSDLTSVYYDFFPIHYAVIRDDLSLIKLLVETGADVKAENINLVTCLHLSKSIPVTEYLLNKGADINAKTADFDNFKNYTPLDYAVYNNNKEKIHYLIKKDAETNNDYGIHEAVLKENIELLNYYIKKNIDINIENEKFFTPLQYACGCDQTINDFDPNPIIVETLLENGATLVPIGGDLSVLQCAVMYDNDKVINLLKDEIKERNKSKMNKNALIENELLMYDRIALDSTHYPHTYYRERWLEFHKNLFFESKAVNKIDFSNLLLKKYLSSAYEKYSFEPYFYQKRKYSQEDINERLGEGVYPYYDIDPETGETILIELKVDPNKYELNGMIFYDDWSFDEYNFKLFKTVKAYSPIRTYYRDDDIDEGPRYKKIGFLVFEDDLNKKGKKRSEARMKLFRKVQYEFYLENDDAHLYENDVVYNDLDLGLYLEKRNSPFWTSYGKTKFRNLIIERVLTTQSKAYDFFSGKQFKVSEIKEKLGASVDTIYYIDPETEDLIAGVIQRPINSSEIKSVIFVEDWYVDEKTMRIKKEIVGVAPIRTYFRDDDIDEEHLQKKIPFIVYFDEPDFNSFDPKAISATIPIDSNNITLSHLPANKNFYYWEQNINNYNFKHKFINTALSGQIKLFECGNEFDDYVYYKPEFYQKMTIDEIKERIGIGKDTVYVIDPETGETNEKAVVREGYGIDSISFISSKETWFFDKMNFKFYKKVHAYSPAIRFYKDENLDSDGPVYKLTGYVINNNENQPNEKLTLFKKLKYEFGFENADMNVGNNIPEVEKNESLFWNNFKKVTFKEVIIESALKGEVNTYDFKSGKKLSADELKQNLLISIDTVYTMDPETGETVPYFISNTVDHETINSFIFIENWYINEKTFAITKEVVGIAPVVYYSNEIEALPEDHKKIIPFVIYFDESKRF